jgi:hypothetical protein
MRVWQSLHGGKGRNAAQAARDAWFRNLTKRFASPRQESWSPAPLPPPLTLLTTLSPAFEWMAKTTENKRNFAISCVLGAAGNAPFSR